ncbi:MAG: tail lysozyme [Bacteriophage sp.]|nr:MAG: tail lysozyme [Bacteriophage sp.]
MAWIVKVGVRAYLTQSEMENNATEFYGYFNSKGFTIESVAGMLGNLQHESNINPGMKQTASASSGWGLIQWTPSSNLTDYATAYGVDWATGEIQTQLMWDEIINGYGSQWKPKPSLGYGYTGAEFSQLTDVAEACKAYLYERERAGVEALTKRLTYANNWYEYLTGVTPPTPPTPPTPTKRKRMPLWMMCRPLF